MNGENCYLFMQHAFTNVFTAMKRGRANINTYDKASVHADSRWLISWPELETPFQKVIFQETSVYYTVHPKALK